MGCRERSSGNPFFEVVYTFKIISTSFFEQSFIDTILSFTIMPKGKKLTLCTLKYN